MRCTKCNNTGEYKIIHYSWQQQTETITHVCDCVYGNEVRLWRAARPIDTEGLVNELERLIMEMDCKADTNE
ncbi:hypothetical protein NUACC26_085500 [Scytonema sp. NUACC26]